MHDGGGRICNLVANEHSLMSACDEGSITNTLSHSQRQNCDDEKLLVAATTLSQHGGTQHYTKYGPPGN